MGMEKLGAKIELEGGYIHARAEKLTGSRINFPISSVGATGNLLMAAVLADGVTVLQNAACEPEIVALANFINTMGGKVKGAGTDQIEIEGVTHLKPATFSNIPDRIEAGTFLCGVALAGGEVKIENVCINDLGAVIDSLERAGIALEIGTSTITVRAEGKAKPVDVKTAPYPGFPTDMQAQWIALMSLAKGGCAITDTIYPDRFTHVAELRRLGADIRIEGNTAFVRGIEKLQGAQVMSTDLRASASLILAGLAAEGRTDLSRIYHIDRGYERIEERLRAVGAQIERVDEPMQI
jgi:UDP-N-acetylglucosamine 1-carboxyvinyltransferase